MPLPFHVFETYETIIFANNCADFSCMQESPSVYMHYTTCIGEQLDITGCSIFFLRFFCSSASFFFGSFKTLTEHHSAQASKPGICNLRNCKSHINSKTVSTVCVLQGATFPRIIHSDKGDNELPFLSLTEGLITHLTGILW